MNKVAINKPANKQLDSLVLLRSIAVLMVCFCHFGYPLLSSGRISNLFKIFDTYGLYGVHVFFVISGFIIPLSLLRGKYELRNYFQFLYKRVLRLHPPYLAALALTLVIMYFSYGSRHAPFPETITSIIRSAFYLHTPPDNPVFWSLLVECQYYIFIGVFYVVLMRRTVLAYFVIMPILLFLCYTVARPLLLMSSYLIFFFLGNIGYMIYTNNGKKIVNFIALSVTIIFIGFYYNAFALIFSVGTLFFILLFRKSVSGLPVFIGNISYSIYLLHFPIGVKFLNFMKTRVSPEYNLLLFGAAILLVIAIAWVFYKVFEEFSERLSKKVKYTPALAGTQQASAARVSVPS